MNIREELIAAMRETFGDDERRINHALKVLHYAERILKKEYGDKQTVMAAAILHDIGIQEAERKHGSSDGKFQEIEGPPIARAILEKFGVGPATIDHVCRIVGSHHSARDIDTPEFRIIWDADWLVNIPDKYPGINVDLFKKHLEKVFRTNAGREIAREELCS